MRNEYAKMSLATVVSGILSGLTVTWGLIALFGPGLFFGLATGWALVNTKKFNQRQAAIWLLTSIASWYLAVQYYDHFAHPEMGLGNPLMAFIGAGAVGSLVLSLAYSFLRRSLNISTLLTLGAGIISAYLMYALLQINSDSAVLFVSAFVIWQVAVGLALLPEGFNRPAKKR